MDDAMQKDYLLLMAEAGEATSGLGALLLEYGSPSAAVAAPEERLADLPASTQQILHRARQRWDQGGRRCGSNQVSADCPSFLAITDRAYPDALRAIEDPPPWLFFSGDADCLKRPAIAIVGSRRASHAGAQIAARVARDLAHRGYLVCSGLALGIDAAAHEGALEAGETVAVLASGLDQASPRRNVGLARRIRSSGCLLSELPRGMPPNRARFPRRNRIISGLCQATIIVEAALPSGTLHTAQAAAEQGRDVYVLPWSLLHPGGRGCLRLLRDGAIPITDLGDLEALFPDVLAHCAAATPRDEDASARASSALDPAEQLILDTLGDGGLSVEDLQVLTTLDAAELLRRLSDLELRGHVRLQAGGYRRNLAPEAPAGKA